MFTHNIRCINSNEWGLYDQSVPRRNTKAVLTERKQVSKRLNPIFGKI